MSDVTLGVDLSDVIVRLAVADASGKVIERGIVASHREAAIKDAAKKALHGGAKVKAIGVATPAAGDVISDDMTSEITSPAAGDVISDDMTSALANATG